MRFYRALLHLYPAAFRAEYGAEMCAIFARRRRDSGSAWGAAGLWWEVTMDVILNAVRSHGDILRQDLRYTARTLRRSPGFTAAVVVVSALGVGATTAAFSITDHVLLRPLPFPGAERLVRMWEHDAARGYYNDASPANYRDWKAASQSFESLGAFRNISVNLVGQGDPERLEGAAVTAEVLPLLGTRPLLGRTFDAADDLEDAPGTVVLSHRLWRVRFGGDPGVLGRKVMLDDAPYVVIGVMPSHFLFPTREVRLWTAMRFPAQAFESRTNTYIFPVARLKPGVSVEDARAELRAIAGRLESAYPQENAGIGVAVRALHDQVARGSRLLVIALFGAALCVLLIACTNLAGLLLARAFHRRQELSVRAALGAGRERLARQLLTESLVLALAGGAVGILLAVMATPLVAQLVPTSLPIAEVPRLDLRILAFAALMTLLTGLGFAVVPALRACSGADLRGLRDGPRAGGAGRERMRSGLVFAEVAVSVVLLVSAGLLIRALWRLQGVDPGFRTEGVLTLRTALPLPRYEKTQARQQFYDRVLADVRALPGVSAAAYATGLPMVMRGGIWGVEVEGQPTEPGKAPPASLRFITPGFFETLRIPLLAGRDVSEADTGQAPFVAVVSRSLAERHWPGQDPLGRRIRFGIQTRTIVGVVGDVRVRGVEQGSEPQVYLPSAQVPDGGLIAYPPKDLVVRSSADAATLLPSIRRIVAQADPQQPISNVRMLEAIVDGETAPRSVQAAVLGGFAALAVFLAGLGIHGLLAFTVSARAREIGVRMALGAGTRDVLRLVLREGLVLAAGGVALGVVLAYAAGRSLQALLAGVRPHDAAAFLTAVIVSLLMVILGSLWPALRAVRVDPLSAIRAE
jgi:predicted permease